MRLKTQIETILEKHYSSINCAPLAEEFKKRNYVKIPTFVPPILETAMKGEVCYMINHHTIRQDLHDPQTSDTPRYMELVSQADLSSFGQIIPTFYSSHQLLLFLSRIVGESLIVSPYECDRFAITKMTRKGDTYGWHWNDSRYLLAWIFETPPAELGGVTEFITDTRWDKSYPHIVDYYLSHGQVQRRTYHVGDIYLLKADEVMHRISPLKQDSMKVVLRMGWANEIQHSYAQA